MPAAQQIAHLNRTAVYWRNETARLKVEVMRDKLEGRQQHLEPQQAAKDAAEEEKTRVEWYR
ncbi:unnamed protein product [Amoebophrya sp. A25]|nr:unnamed protein product [Amoebophrya sp. A25]|eukprot:GSA25T00027677001.1